MNSSKYWTQIGIWVFLYLSLPFLIPFFIQGTFNARDASSIGDASGALTVIGTSYGAMAINLLIALGLSWTVFHRLREIGWSAFFVGFIFCALSSGFSGTAATPFSAYGFSMFFGWALVPAIGFLIFLGFYDQDVRAGSSQDNRILEISKAIIIGSAIFFALMTLKSGILNFEAIPFMSEIFMKIADVIPSMYKILRSIGISPYTIRTVFTVLFILALAIYWYVSKMVDSEEGETHNFTQQHVLQPQKQEGFGQRR